MPINDDRIAVRSGRAVRLLRYGGIASGIAWNVGAGVLREWFVFGTMQTDLDVANDRHQPKNGRIVLLDFGAVPSGSPDLAADFRAHAQDWWHVSERGPIAGSRRLRPMVEGYCDMGIAPR